jgi:hypothetical protein
MDELVAMDEIDSPKIFYIQLCYQTFNINFYHSTNIAITNRLEMIEIDMVVVLWFSLKTILILSKYTNPVN